LIKSKRLTKNVQKSKQNIAYLRFLGVIFKKQKDRGLKFSVFLLKTKIAGVRN
jgi:hypothetical protein